MRYIFVFLFITVVSFGQKKSNLSPEIWVDSVYNQLSFDEKVGQLFMVAAYSNKDEAHNKSLDKLIEENKIGGLIFFQGGPMRQAKLTNRYQAKSKVPLFIGIDAEWGLSMRLDSTYRYPWNMTLGAVQDMNLIEKAGNQMAKQSKRMGIQFNFAPVVDINTNPKNPIIGNRSFGETKENVTLRALALMKGLQDEGVYATAKHFPGHGLVTGDTHKSLQTIDGELKELGIYPPLIENGVLSIMIAHIAITNNKDYDSKGMPATTSDTIVTKLLRNKLNFKGLIVTDAMNMGGVSQIKNAAVKTIDAGCDIMLMPLEIKIAYNEILNKYKANEVFKLKVDNSVKRIVRMKICLGLIK